ncbi:MAG TPA: heterodisulfide reductase-related iron-sulfur binding cluster [Kofleriaceae bacterium]|jgi:glycolate oxidase iron-sulfur subunit|nr:heterodisulfide reductase-related iron-sulfur binding cluster [Kofleriaceae bacterium]
MTAKRRLLDDCVHCGFCLPACPTYQSWGEEMDSPRGRIHLMKLIADAKQPLTSAAVDHFDRCLGCMACMTACPSGVQYGALIEQTRAMVERDHRRGLADRLFRGMIFALFPYPRRLKLAMVGQLIYQRTGLRWLAHRLGLVRLLPRRLRNLEALMPPVSVAKLADRLPAALPAAGPRRTRVAVLPGCVQRVYFPEVNQATLRVLAAEGCEVVVPPALGCCGALSLHAGRDGEARRFARAAIEVLEQTGADAIAVNAAGCGSSMKEWGHLLADDPAWAERARTIAAKVKDVSELLAGQPAVARRHPVRLRVAYHDACHLAHAQRIRAEPRALLAAIPGLELVELDSDTCCGSAGVHNLLEPESAREIGERKVDSVIAAAPDLLVSANPGCTLQIQMLLRERGRDVRTAHPIEVLDASIRGVPPADPERRP